MSLKFCTEAAAMITERIIKPAVLESAKEKGHGGPNEEKHFKEASDIGSPELTSPVHSQGLATFFKSDCNSENMGNKLPAGCQ